MNRFKQQVRPQASIDNSRVVSNFLSVGFWAGYFSLLTNNISTPLQQNVSSQTGSKFKTIKLILQVLENFYIVAAGLHFTPARDTTYPIDFYPPCRCLFFLLLNLIWILSDATGLEARAN